MSKAAQAPEGYRADRWSRDLGRGDQVFAKGADALRQWRVHPLARALAPIARRLQLAATNRYLNAMQAAVED